MSNVPTEVSRPMFTLVCSHCDGLLGMDYPSIRYCSAECERSAWRDAREAADELGLDLELPETPPFARAWDGADPAKMLQIREMDIDRWARSLQTATDAQEVDRDE